MSQGNEWTVEDIIKTMQRDREIHVHKTISNQTGLRYQIALLLEKKMVKEVHANEDYRFYQLTSLAKQPHSRSKGL
jgi:hypothetical protein